MAAEGPNGAAARRVAFLYSAELERYRYPADCPFKAERAGMTRRIVAPMGLLSGPGRMEIAPRAATDEELTVFHTPRYLEVLREAEGGHLDLEGLEMGLGTAETPVFKGMVAYASLAAGASLGAADLILEGDAVIAFNPSGGYHHAHPQRAGGFCYINDVVLACERLVAGGKRVAFLDIDVHHSDGVQAAFYGRDDVMVLSVHESGETLFPGTGWADEIGAGAGLGYTVNVPLPTGIHDEAFGRVMEELALPLMSAFDPDVVVLELGMDMLAGDPLAHESLTNNAYAAAVRDVMALGRPIVAVGGGGYNAEHAARGWALVWSIFCGQQEAYDDLQVGLGGVMLGTPDWQGGLRDRALAASEAQRRREDEAVSRLVERLRGLLFGIHGLA